MPELPIEATPNPAEVETLRRVNAELVAKHARNKARIAELETGAATLQSKLAETSESLHQVTVGVPLKAMCESMSTVPELFLEQLSKHFKVESVKGALTLLSADGKPVLGKDKKPIPFEQKALTEFLIDGDDSRAKTFQAITIVSRASGASNIATNSRSKQAQLQRFQFGLK